MNLSKLWEIEEYRGAWHAAVHWGHRVRYYIVTEQQQAILLRGFGEGWKGWENSKIQHPWILVMDSIASECWKLLSVFCFLFFFNLIGLQLIYNVVLVSLQKEMATHSSTTA